MIPPFQGRTMVESVNINEKLHFEDVLTSEEVAKFLKVSVGAVRRWTRKGTLKGHGLGGKGDWRYLKKYVTD